MRALAKIKNLTNDECKRKIIRNLGRILDIRIIDIDIIKGMLFFVYENPIAFEQVKKELRRIDCPIINYKCSGQHDALLHQSLTNVTTLT